MVKAKGPAKAGSKPKGDLLSPVVAIAAWTAVAAGIWRSKKGDPLLLQPGLSQTAIDAAVVAGSSAAIPAPRRPPPPFALNVDRWQQRHRVVGFLVGVVRKFGDDRAGYLAALVSYFGFFSLFPLLLAMTSILGFVLQDNADLQAKISSKAAEQIPFIGRDIANNVGELKGSVIAIVIGLAGAIWAGLRVIDALQNALNEVWDVPVAGRPNLVKRRLRGVASLGLFGVALIGSMAAGSLARLLPDLPGVGRYGIYAITALLNVGVFLLAFQVLSELRHPWRELLPGAIVAAVGWSLMQTFGAAYLEDVQKKAGPTYDKFATVIALLTFLFITSQIVILAAEVNVVNARKLWPRTLLPLAGGLTEADRRAYAHYADSQRRVPTQRILVDYEATPNPEQP